MVVVIEVKCEQKSKEFSSSSKTSASHLPETDFLDFTLMSCQHGRAGGTNGGALRAGLLEIPLRRCAGGQIFYEKLINALAAISVIAIIDGEVLVMTHIVGEVLMMGHRRYDCPIVLKTCLRVGLYILRWYSGGVEGYQTEEYQIRGRVEAKHENGRLLLYT